jgi:hypothetical protein
VSTTCREVEGGVIEALFCNGCGHRTESAADSPSEWLICARCARIEFVQQPRCWASALVAEPSGAPLTFSVQLPPGVEPIFDQYHVDAKAPRGQTRTGSAIEVATNILVGFSINWVANLLILPLYGFQITGGQAFSMGLIFTAIAIVRGYVLRRVFNRIRSLHHE